MGVDQSEAAAIRLGHLLFIFIAPFDHWEELGISHHCPCYTGNQSGGLWQGRYVGIYVVLDCELDGGGSVRSVGYNTLVNDYASHI